MDWLLGQICANHIVSSAVLILWSSLFFFSCVYLKIEYKQLVLWGLALLALSLQPLAHLLAGRSVFAACLLLWVSQSLGSLFMLLGLFIHRLKQLPHRIALPVWCGITVIAIGGLLLCMYKDSVSIWLASLFLLQGVFLVSGLVLAILHAMEVRQVPFFVALLLYAATSVFYAGSLLNGGMGIASHGLLSLLNSLALSNTMCFYLVVQEAKKGNEALAKLKSLVDHTSQGLAFVDNDGKVQQMNRRLLEILGSDTGAGKDNGHQASDLGLDNLLAAASEGGAARITIDFDSLALAGVPVRRSGQAHLVVTTRSVEGAGGKAGRFVQIDDVTEQDNILIQLMENRFRMDLMMKAADAYEYSREGQCLTAADWFKALGHDFESIDMREFLDYVHPHDRAKYPVHAITEAPKPGVSYAAEGRFRNAEGNYVWFYVSSCNVVLDNKVITLGMALNIDKHKRVEQYVMQNDRLAAAGQLANGVAHDINNHLMTIQTSLGLINTVTDEVQRKKFTSYMQEALANSAGILKRLVSFSKGDEEGFAPVSMNSMLSQSKELLERALYREAALSYTNDADRDLVLGNYYELQNIVLNIGLNARDALPEKGGQIMIRSWTASVNPLKQEQGAGWYFISVRDNGCGMTIETQKRIFDPFFSTKPQGRGSGLGLFTSFGNVQRHGGTISVESAQGMGTEFILAFPLAEESVSVTNSHTMAAQM